MVRIFPFRALRPRPAIAARVASLPYDVVTTDEARALAADEPLSFLHVVRSEIDLPADVDPHDDRVYATARANLRRLVDDGVLVRDATPSLHLYRLVREHRAQVGLVACAHVDDYEAGTIRRHELTRPDKENDRTRHVLETNANAGPVFLAFRDDPAVARAMTADMNDRPIVHFNAPDGVTHSVWPVRDPSRYVDAFARMPAVYVADGHHRAASAARAARTRAAANPDHHGDEEYNRFLVALFPASRLTILPYNRVVRDLGGRRPAEVREALAAVGTLAPAAAPEPGAAHAFGVYLDGAWHRLTLDPDSIDRADPVGSLGYELLQRRVLEPVLGITDVRTDPRIDFVGGIHGPRRLQAMVDAGEAAIAFCMHPTGIDELFAVADAGLVMPPKSTWFEPKLRSGLFVHELD